MKSFQYIADTYMHYNNIYEVTQNRSGYLYNTALAQYDWLHAIICSLYN